MSRDIGPSLRQPGSSQEVRSQLALELLLNLYAVVGALVVLRTLLLAIGVDGELWIGGAIYGVSAILASPLTALPGASFVLVGQLTLADATLLAAVVLFPLGLYVAGRRYGKYRAL